MIEKTYYDTRPDGVELYQRKSTLNVKIRQLETGEAYDDPIDIEPCPFTYEETDIPVDPDPEPSPEPIGDLTVTDTLEIPIQEEDNSQEILDYYIDGIKKGYISNDDIPLKYRDKIVEYLK